jgi:coenzyme PQQ synthesis protein D (PqqD)
MSEIDSTSSRDASPPRQRASVKREEVQETGECVLLEPSEGRVLALNPLGSALWELLDGDRDSAELAQILAEATGVELERARADVDALLARLGAEGFLARRSSH